MIVKINKKPIQIVEDCEENESKGWVYVCISGLGYLLAFYVLDYVCFTFLFIHPFPFVMWVGKVMALFGSIL